MAETDNVWHVIHCDSRYLSDTESRYAIIELELLSVVWAVPKCRLSLPGMSFQLITDHQLLVPILNSEALDLIENPCLLRLCMKLQAF